MDKNIIYISVFLFLIGGNVLAQVPQINNLESTHTWPGDTITITGANFSANIADLQVWFGSVEGQITSATETVIEVIVPEEARFDPISVLNKSTGLRGYSAKKFYPVFSGDEAFDPSKFSTPIDFNTATGEKEFYDVMSCDFNLDGKPDIVATKDKDVGILLLKNNSTFENLQFDSTVITPVPYPGLNLGCGDLNGDGLPELLFSRSGATNNYVYILPNTSSGGTISFGSPISIIINVGTTVFAKRIKLADLNFDGKPDLVVTNGNGSSFFIFKNTSTKTSISFSSSPTTLTIGGASTNGLEILDIDGDRLPDIVVNPFFDENIYIFKNTSTSSTISFNTPIVKETSTRVINVKAGDLDNDGLPELITTGVTGNQLLIFPNLSNSNINFGSEISFSTGNSPWGLDLADMNGDRVLDVVVGNQNQPQIDVFINSSTPGNFSITRRQISTALNVRNITVNDFDGDGKPDIAYTTYLSNGPYRVEIIRNQNCFIPRFRNDEGLAICPGQTIRLKTVPNTAATFNWSKDGAAVKSGSDNFLNITESGVYEVEAVTEGGACIQTRTYEVLSGQGTVPGDPSPTSNTPVCAGADIELQVDAVTNATYEWTGPNNFSSSERLPVISAATTEMAGVYSVKIKVGDCLSSEKTTTVEVVTLPVFTVTTQSPTSFCEGASNTLTVTQRSGYTYQWLKDGVEISGAINSTYAANSSGGYSVLVTEPAPGVCSMETNAIEINVLSSPIADFTLSNSTVCVGEEITITNNSTVDPNATVVYSWTLGNGETSADPSPTASYATAGQKNLTLNVSYTGVSGCTSSKTVSATVVEATLPAITASVAESCPGEQVDLSIAGTYQQITWSTGESTAAITVDSPGTYTVNTLDNNGCAGEDQEIITAKAVPTVAATADRTLINAGEKVQLSASGADTYSWEPLDLVDDPSIANPIGTPLSDTTFVVVGTLTTGCSDTASVKITVNQGEGLPINPPKVFSPESTINPTWEIDYAGLNEQCEIAIYDERGRMILEDLLNDATKIFTWDATYNGNPLPEGVYYYVVGCPTEGKKAGTVLVVRK